MPREPFDVKLQTQSYEKLSDEVVVKSVEMPTRCYPTASYSADPQGITLSWDLLWCRENQIQLLQVGPLDMPSQTFVDKPSLFIALDTGVAMLYTVQAESSELGETTVGGLFYKAVPCDYLLHTDEEDAVRLVGEEEVRMSVTLGNLANVS